MNADSTHLRWYQGMTGYHWLVLIVATCGWMFDTMDQWLYVQARQPAIQTLMGPGAPAEEVAKMGGWVQAAFLFGWATGGLLFGVIGDRLGRTLTMTVTVLMYAIFTGLSGLAQDVWQFALFRFLTGLGIGGEFAAGAALIAETLPQHSRATALSIMQACSAIGNMMAGFVGLGMSAAVASDVRWRYMFFIGVAPALLVFIIRMFVREPERWQVAREEAKRTGLQLGQIRDVFADPELRRRALVGVALAAVGVIGFWGIGTFSPDLLRGALNPDENPALKQRVDQQVSLAVIAQNAGAFFGILLWARLAIWFGRRPAFAMSLLGCLVAVPATFHFTDSALTAFLLFPILGFVTTSLFGGYAVYFPELFPTRLRATGIGICYNVARYIAISGPWIFAMLRDAQVSIQMAATYISVVFLLGLLVLPFAPETRGKPLPE